MFRAMPLMCQTLANIKWSKVQNRYFWAETKSHWRGLYLWIRKILLANLHTLPPFSLLQNLLRRIPTFLRTHNAPWNHAITLYLMTSFPEEESGTRMAARFLFYHRNFNGRAARTKFSTTCSCPYDPSLLPPQSEPIKRKVFERKNKRIVPDKGTVADLKLSKFCATVNFFPQNQGFRKKT